MRSEGIRDALSRAFRTCGAAVTIVHGGEETETFGFVQPITSESGGEPFSAGPLGACDKRCWRYLGDAQTRVEQGDRLICAGKRYRVRRAEEVRAGGFATHRWAVLDREEAET